MEGAAGYKTTVWIIELSNFSSTIFTLSLFMKLLQFALILEWPFLVVALALTSWGLSFIIDQRDYKRGTLYPQYGDQIFTYTSTWLSTVTSDSTPVSTVARATYTGTRTLYPNEYGTAFYSSEYSMIGSIPTFQPITKRSAIPTQAPAQNFVRAPIVHRRAYWADHSDEFSNVYSSSDGDTHSIVSAMVIPFSLLLAALAVRVLLTPIYLAHLHFGGLTEKGQHSWNEALVSITTIFVVVMWGSAISGFYFYCSLFEDSLYKSIGLILTIIFCGIVCLSSVFSLVLMCVQLHKGKKIRSFQMNNNEEKKSSRASDNTLTSEASSV